MWERSPGAWVDPACPVEWGHPLNCGLVLWWMGLPQSGWWGGERIRDLVRGGKAPSDGTVIGATWAGGQNGLPCLSSVSNGQGAEVATPATLKNGWPLSISCWVYREAAPAAGAEIAGIAHNNTDSDPYAVFMFQYRNTEDGQVNLIGNAGGTFFYHDGIYTVPPKTWTHLYAVHTTTFRQAFANGVQIHYSSSSYSSPTYGASTLTFVGNHTGISRHIGGRVADFRAWATAINEESTKTIAKALYAQGLCGHPDTLRWASSRAYSLPPPSSGDIAGTAALAFAAGSSTLTGAGALAGASALVFDDGSSVLVGAGALAGASALVFGAGSSTILGAGALVGSSALMFAAGSSTLAGAGALAGAAALVFGAGNSVLGGPGDMVGSAALAFGAGSSTLTGTGSLAGPADLVFAAGSSTLTGSGALAGAAALVFDDGSSVLVGSGALAGSGALVFGAGSSTLVAAGTGSIAGVAALTFSATASLSGVAWDYRVVTGLPARVSTSFVCPARVSTSLACLARVVTSFSLEASEAMSVFSNLEMFRGEDVTFTFTLDPVVDITGATITWGLRLSTASTPLVSKTATIVSGSAGVFSVSLAYADTSGIAVGQYVWDCRRQPAGSKATLAHGTIDVRSEVIA